MCRGKGQNRSYGLRTDVHGIICVYTKSHILWNFVGQIVHCVGKNMFGNRKLLVIWRRSTEVMNTDNIHLKRTWPKDLSKKWGGQQHRGTKVWHCCYQFRAPHFWIHHSIISNCLLTIFFQENIYKKKIEKTESLICWLFYFFYSQFGYPSMNGW